MSEKFFKLKISIPDLDKYVSHGLSCTGLYDAELIINEDSDREISIKIFYNDQEYLGEKLLRWASNNDFKLLDKFQISEIKNDEYSHNGDLIGISFEDYKCKGISNGSAYYNKDDFKYIIVKLNGIKLIYSNSRQATSTFYLNHEAFDLIELNYRYKPNYNNDDFKLDPQNSVKDFITFNTVLFKPEHNFYNFTTLHTSEILIKKEPRFSVKYSGVSEIEVKAHINLICTLYSFFSNQKINYFLSKIYTKDKLYVELRDLKHGDPKIEEGIFYFDFSRNPRNLIETVDSLHLLENPAFTYKIVDRFNFALKTEGESRFMILYNVLEQIRNEYIRKGFIEQEKLDSKKVNEEYKFTVSKTKRDEFIKNKIKEIAEIVDDEHKELFLNETSQKIRPIVVFSMINQFKSLFDYLNIDPNTFGLDFAEIKTLRDVIFHGNPVGEKKNLLDEMNKYKYLPRFVGIIILKYFGIDDISKIEKYKY